MALFMKIGFVSAIVGVVDEEIAVVVMIASEICGGKGAFTKRVHCVEDESGPLDSFWIRVRTE
jgi:hypothetical protein